MQIFCARLGVVDEPEMPQHADRGEYGAEARTDMLGK